MCLGGQLKEYQYADGYHHREDVPQATSKNQNDVNGLEEYLLRVKTGVDYLLGCFAWTLVSDNMVNFILVGAMRFLCTCMMNFSLGA